MSCGNCHPVSSITSIDAAMMPMENVMHECARARLRAAPAARYTTARRAVARLLLLCAAIALPAPPTAVWATPSNPHGLAVIIGNHNSLHPDMPPADYAHRDARAFKRYVIDVLGYGADNIIHLEDATERQMHDVFGSPGASMSDIQTRLNILAPAEGADVIVYYSGHGVPSEEGASLLPVDIAPHEARTGNNSLKRLYEKLGVLQRTKSVQVYLDAGFSGDSHVRQLIWYHPLYRELALPGEVPDDMMILTAATGAEIAGWDTQAGHGLFTHHLLDALYGKGDANGDGQVTAREAKAYLDDTMSLASRRQHHRIQRASLAGATETVVASARSGVEFPARPAPSSPSSAADTE